MTASGDTAGGEQSTLGIGERIDQLDAIVETLEDGEIDLETAKDLREEADDHLRALRDQLDVGDGEIIELSAENADLDLDEET